MKALPWACLILLFVMGNLLSKLGVESKTVTNVLIGLVALTIVAFVIGPTFTYKLPEEEIERRNLELRERQKRSLMENLPERVAEYQKLHREQIAEYESHSWEELRKHRWPRPHNLVPVDEDLKIALASSPDSHDELLNALSRDASTRVQTAAKNTIKSPLVQKRRAIESERVQQEWAREFEFRVKAEQRELDELKQPNLTEYRLRVIKHESSSDTVRKLVDQRLREGGYE